MRVVAGTQNTPYVVSSRPSSLAKLTTGTIMTSESELGLRITDATTLADVFQYIEDHADEVDAKVAGAHPEGQRSVKHGFLVCYESNRSPPFTIVTQPSGARITRIGVIGYQGQVGFIEPTLYVFARAPGEVKNKWYIPAPASRPAKKAKPNPVAPPPHRRPAELPLHPVGTVLQTFGTVHPGFDQQFVRVTKHVDNSTMLARRLQTRVNRVVKTTFSDGSAGLRTYHAPTNVIVPGGKSIELVPQEYLPYWTSTFRRHEVWWTPTLGSSINPIMEERVVHTKRQVNAGKKIMRALWKRVQKKQQENALAPGGSTARAAIARATRAAGGT